MAKKRIIWYVLIHIVLPLVFGLAVYLTLRPYSWVSILVEKLFPTIHEKLHFHDVQIINSSLFVWISNFLADYLWAYAFENSLLVIGQETVTNRNVLLYIGLVVSLIMELVQILLPFLTFDILDIIVEWLGIVCAWFVFWKAYKQSLCSDDEKECK